MKLWMIRHGESETNRRGQWTGWLDAALTEKGREDAARARGVIAGVKFDKIYSSDLSRARSTAEIAMPGCEYESTALLREINVGSIAGRDWDVLEKSQIDAVFREGYTCYGGESALEFGARVGEFMRLIEAEEGENIIAFTHGGFIKTFLKTVLGVEFFGKSVISKNCMVAVFEYSDSTWKLHSWINLD